MSMLDIERIYNESAYKMASELQAYIGLYMKPTAFDFGKGKSKAPPRNTAKGVGTLRLITGTLYRSFTPNKPNMNNIYVAKTTGNNFQFEYGSSLPYAAIHEYGGVAGNGAKIPRRPYLKPAQKEWKSKRLSAFRTELKLQIIREMKTWLANQKPLKR